MIENENEESRITGEFLKKSLIEIPSDNFTDKVMGKIETGKAYEKVSFLNIKLSWFFLTIAVVMAPLSLRLIAVGIHLEKLMPYKDKVSPVLMVLFSFLVLLQLDNLLKTLFVRKKSRIIP